MGLKKKTIKKWKNNDLNQPSLTRQTLNSDHEIEITLWKANQNKL